MEVLLATNSGRRAEHSEARRILTMFEQRRECPELVWATADRADLEVERDFGVEPVNLADRGERST
jgi:hypothetical protein